MSALVQRRQLLTAYLGNLFEHYDMALFGFLSPFLAQLIFPNHEPIVALILTYAMIPLGMLARPLGAIAFGYIGDKYGRGQALFLTLAGMSIVSGCIAMSPTYLQVGLWAPIIFCVGRVLQNFFAAGESMGGAIFILENSSEKRHDLLSSVYSTSTMAGHLLASFGVFMLSYLQFIDSGWRLLYLFGCITALFGCMLRRPLNVIPAEKFSTNMQGLWDKLWTHRKLLLFIALNAGFAHATYSIALVLMNGFIPLISSVTKTQIMEINTYLLIFDMCALPLFGWVASRIGREKLMFASAIGAVLLAAPLFLLLEQASWTTIILVRMIFVLLGVSFFAPFYAWAQQLVPANCRYAIISLGYAIGAQLFGSPTAAISLWTFQKTGIVASAAWYWMALGLASTLSLIYALRYRKEAYGI